MGELEGARPSGAGPPPVLLRAGLRAHTHLSVPCRRKRMEDEEEVRSGGVGPHGLGLGWGLSSSFCFSPCPQVSLDFAVPPPSTVVPVFALLCAATLGICSLSPASLSFLTFVSLWACPFHTRGGTLRSRWISKTWPLPCSYSQPRLRHRQGL